MPLKSTFLSSAIKINLMLDIYVIYKKKSFFPPAVFLIMLLKGPKREMFVAGIFTEIRPVWVGNLETRPKNQKNLSFRALYYPYFLGFLF
jgi:hypothetical protein